MIAGRATLEGTSRFGARAKAAQGHFRAAMGVSLSSIGLGTYLGKEDTATDGGPSVGDVIDAVEILRIVGELHAVPFELGIPRVYSVLKLDERRDKEQTLEDKVASVQRLLDD